MKRIFVVAVLGLLLLCFGCGSSKYPIEPSSSFINAKLPAFSEV